MTYLVKKSKNYYKLFKKKVYRAFLYTPGCPGTHCVDQVGPSLTEIHLLCLLSSGIKGVHQHVWKNVTMNHAVK